MEIKTLSLHDKDTLYHQIPDWSFENQNSQTITSEHWIIKLSW